MRPSVNTTSMRANGASDRPPSVSGASGVQSQSRTRPPCRIGRGRSRGTARRMDTASTRLDFPDPFAPMTTFNGSSGKSSVPWPKDRKPSRAIAFRRGCGGATSGGLLRCRVAGPGVSQKGRVFGSWPAAQEVVLRLRSLVLLAPRPPAVRHFIGQRPARSLRDPDGLAGRRKLSVARWAHTQASRTGPAPASWPARNRSLRYTPAIQSKQEDAE